MSYTAIHQTERLTWLTVASGAGDCLIQLQSDGPVDVYLGANPPDPSLQNDHGNHGILLVDDALMEISVQGMVDGDVLWVRSTQAEANTVAVLGTGVEPTSEPVIA